MVLAGSTLAAAQGWHDDYEHHDRDYDRRVDEGHRYNAGDRGQWVPLAAMNITRKETVDIGLRAGPFRALRLQAQRGVAYVDFVTIRFGNGEQQHIDIHRRIGAGEVADIDTQGPNGGRNIAAVTVHGRPDRWSRIQIIGLR
jgi:hypothetical protein